MVGGTNDALVAIETVWAVLVGKCHAKQFHMDKGIKLTTNSQVCAVTPMFWAFALRQSKVQKMASS